MENKKNNFWNTVSFIICIFILISSCKQKDSCNIPCFNGACVNNSCACSTGYEGDSCTVLSTQKFIGDWSAIDLCDTTTYGYTVTIAASSSVLNQLVITNFGEFGTTFFLNADISGFTFTVPQQIVEGITLSGNGTVDTVTKTITATYTAMDDLNNINTCTGTWTKQ